MFQIRSLTADDPAAVPPHRRISIGYADMLLGGGIATKMLTTVFGQAGAGKSTLMLELACAAARSAATLYAVAPDEQDPDDILRVAHRINANVDGLGLATIDTVGDAIAAATEFGAKLLIVDSLNAAAGFNAPHIQAGIRRIKEWCRANDAAALAVGMYDTAGRRAGGYSVAYRPHATIDLIGPDDPRFGPTLARLTIDQGDILGEGSLEDLRLLSVDKSRFCRRGVLPLRMTAGGLKPNERDIDAQLRALTTSRS